jgi:hypothetical protein
MNYIYISAGIIFSMFFVAQMLAFAAFTKKQKVYVRNRHGRKDER